ncbi:MFS transporter superfamily [Arabidopsis suecica]|uniref:MFS transporter superfamily n=1 Tax=Arabidopsis suecica TaxID=45249 RepID=A0A8T2AJ58_ARASU|nr:MFS transporter superfamily [Arabidopsis suecica]KAG7572147.1 MFS transporter superfamily [Arabidopsis suecica]
MLFGTIVGSLADKQSASSSILLFSLSSSSSSIIYCSSFLSLTYLESFYHLLYYLHSQLYHQTFSPVQSFDGRSCSWWYRYFPPLFCLRILACCSSSSGYLSLSPRQFSFGNFLVDSLALGPVAPFDAAACFLAIGMAVIISSWSENYGDPSENKDLLTQFKDAASAIASDEKIALLGAIQSLFEGSMYTFVFLWTPALSPNEEDIPHGFIFATFMLASMLGSSIASRLLAHSSPKVESYMQIVFVISSAALMLPVVTSFLVAPSGVKGGSISFSGCIQLMGFCTFEACVGIFWPSIMKMRSQYIPEEARSTIMNFFRIPLNIFVCLVLYNVDAFPMTVMFGMCSVFLFLASILQRRLMNVAEIHKSRSQEWSEAKELTSEADPLNP